MEAGSVEAATKRVRRAVCTCAQEPTDDLVGAGRPGIRGLEGSSSSEKSCEYVAVDSSVHQDHCCVSPAGDVFSEIEYFVDGEVEGIGTAYSAVLLFSRRYSMTQLGCGSITELEKDNGAFRLRETTAASLDKMDCLFVDSTSGGCPVMRMVWMRVSAASLLSLRFYGLSALL